MNLNQDILTIDAIIKMPLMELPVKAILVKLASGVILISPTAVIDKYLTEIKAMGEVTDIVAPNLYHHLSIPLAKSIFPKAKLWGVAGFSQKRTDIAWQAELNATNWPYQTELSVVELKGHPHVNEVVFYHKKSKSIICSDLCFNVLNAKGIGPFLIMSLFGTYNKFGISKFFLRGIVDREAFKKSLEDLLSLDFENIIMAHGSEVKGNGKKLLTEAIKARGLL